MVSLVVGVGTVDKLGALAILVGKLRDVHKLNLREIGDNI